MIPKLSVIGCCLMALHLQAAASEESPEHSIRKSVNQFTKSFLELISKDIYMINDNFANSGLSTWLGLWMIYNGAAGNTKKQIEKVLFDPTLFEKVKDHGSIVRAQKSFIHELRADPRMKSLINKMFLDNKIAIKSQFKSNIENYSSSSQSVDFSAAAEATKFINRWIDEQTNSTIKEVIMPNELTPLTKIVLVNVIKFTGNWQKPFDSYLTALKDFYLHNGRVIQTPTMQNEVNCLEGSINEISADFIQIPFEESDHSSNDDEDNADDLTYMTIILPRISSNVSHIEKILPKLNLLQIIRARRQNRMVRIFLPKFKIETDINLVEPMKNLGMTEMFSSAANFSEISDMPLHVSTISQKMIFEINENGMSSTSATAMSMSLRSFPDKEYQVNRPFLAFIVRKNVILFSARVFDPRI